MRPWFYRADKCPSWGMTERDRDGQKEMGKWLPRCELVLLYVFLCPDTKLEFLATGY